MPSRKLKEYLDAQGVKYVSIVHSPAFTATEIAQSVHIPGRQMAKTVMVKVEGKMAMAVLASTQKVVFDLLREVTGTDDVELAYEQEFQDLFPDCEVGAMPPFGNLYGTDVYVSESLARDDEIAFNAGTHMEVIKMKYSDFERLVKPKVVQFASR